jgi:hypothetical protein
MPWGIGTHTRQRSMPPNYSADNNSRSMKGIILTS